MKWKVILLGTVAALSLTAVSQSNAHNQGWYAGLEAGANWINDNDAEYQFNDEPHFSYSEPVQMNFDTGWAALGTVGYAFDNNWRIEGEIGYRKNDVDAIFGGKQVLEFTQELVLDGPYEPTRINGELTEISLMANVLYDIPLADKLSLNVGVGAGADYSKFKDGLSVNDGDWSFAYQAIAGLSYALSDRLDLTLTYRYLHVNQPTYSDAAPYSGTDTYAFDDLEKHTVTVGLRYDLYADEAPVVVAPPPPPPPPPVVTKQFVVFFGFNKSNLTPEAMSVIKEAAAVAKSQGSASILVIGHTDTVGSNKYNDALSLRRSGAVKKGLIGEGVAEGSIIATGKGETELLIKTGDNVKEPQNRRATIDLN